MFIPQQGEMFDREFPAMRPVPFMGQPDYRIHEMNRRLQQRTEESDNLWWDAFATEFFEDDASLTLSFSMEDGPKRYTIGRSLIPRYFRSMFEGGITDLYYVLKYCKESFQNTSIILDCEQAMMITHHSKPVFTKVVTEGRLLLEFTFDDLMRIRSWHFMTRQHHELEPGVAEQLSQNITRQGLTNTTVNFLRLCVILEPMQELMGRHKVYGLSPRDCLKTTLFQKWQRIVAPPETSRPAAKRRKKKPAAGAASNSMQSTSPTASRHKKSPGPPVMFGPLVEDVMLVGEPTLMGGELGDEDERLITRLENTQYKPSPDDELDMKPLLPPGGGPMNQSAQLYPGHGSWGADGKVPAGPESNMPSSNG